MFKLESPLNFNHIQFKSPTCIYRKTLLLRSFIHLYKWGVHLILYLDPKLDPFFTLTLDPGTTQILCWIRIQIWTRSIKIDSVSEPPWFCPGLDLFASLPLVITFFFLDLELEYLKFIMFYIQPKDWPQLPQQIWKHSYLGSLES